MPTCKLFQRTFRPKFLIFFLKIADVNIDKSSLIAVQIIMFTRKLDFNQHILARLSDNRNYFERRAVHAAVQQLMFDRFSKIHG